MNPAREPEFNPTSDTERIEFLLSRQLDGDLTQEEAGELAQAPETESRRAWLAASADLRVKLRALPVKPVTESFSASVRNTIRQEASAAPADAMSNRPRGWITRGVVAVSVTACLATVMLIVRTQDGAPIPRNMARMNDNVATMEKSAKMNVADADSAQEAAVSETTAHGEDLRPFLDNDDWRIVVVKVHSKDREEVIHDIEALVAKNGMEFRPVGSRDDHDARFGVLLTSTGVDDKVFIESILPQTDAQSTDWNAQSVADSTRENLIARLQESMKIPTHSEIHFGQVYVTLPKPTDPPVAEALLLAKNSPDDEPAPPSVAAQNAGESASRTAVAPPVVKLPVLVVFEFTDEATNHI